MKLRTHLTRLKKKFVLCGEIAAKESLPLKKKIKKRVPRESEEVIKKRTRLHRIAEIKNAESAAINMKACVRYFLSNFYF